MQRLCWHAMPSISFTRSCSEDRCGTARSTQTLSLPSSPAGLGCSSQLTVSAPATSSQAALSRCCPAVKHAKLKPPAHGRHTWP